MISDEGFVQRILIFIFFMGSFLYIIPAASAQTDQLKIIITEASEKIFLFPQREILLLVDFSNIDCEIDKVDFYYNEILIKTDLDYPFECEWDGLEAGSHQLRAVVWKNNIELRAIKQDIMVGDTFKVPGDCSTIQECIDKAATGDLVIISPGLYKENIVISGKRLMLASNYHLSGIPESIEQTIIDGSKDNAGTIRIENADGSKIKGLTIQNGDHGIISFSMVEIFNNNITMNRDGVSFESSSGVVRSNLIVANKDDGIDIDGSSQVEISGNIIRDNGDDGIENRLHPHDGLLLATKIIDNVINGNGEDGIQLIDHDGPSNRAFVIKKNLIFDNIDAGLGLMDQGITIEDFRGAGIQDRIIVANNSFVGNFVGLAGGVNLIAVNNLFVNSKEIGLKNVTGNSIATYNLFWGNKINYTESNVEIKNTIVQDPLLNADYSHKPGSPSTDAGVSIFEWKEELIFEISTDLFSGLSPDLGAYEFNFIKGDVNADGSLNLNDVVATFKVLSGSHESVYKQADTNLNGKLDMIDAVYILQRSAGFLK